MMTYKGYQGQVEFDADAEIFHGEVINTRDVITFQGESVDGLKAAFQESIDDYLEFCQERGESPEKPFSGQFVTRIPPELHRQVYAKARSENVSLNNWVKEQLKRGLESDLYQAPNKSKDNPVRRTDSSSKRKSTQGQKTR